MVSLFCNDNSWLALGNSFVMLTEDVVSAVWMQPTAQPATTRG
jgi:hypothetical protein